MRRFPTLLLAILLSLPGVVRAADVSEKVIDAVAQSALDTFHAPGIAIAVVRDDKVTYLKGHGVREAGSKDKVTEDTVFPIMSCSKAFTATAVALMIDDGKMKWDDPVRKHLPSFRLSDPLADRDVTIRDLLCHRTGLIRHDILWFRSTLSREELLQRMAFLPQDKPFRAEYHYNNFMFLAAGQAAGAAGKSTWEGTVRERIFKPLGMKSSVCSVKEAIATPDHVSAHRRNADGKAERMDWMDIENMGPAGAVATTARDVTQWLRLQLSNGEIDGKRIISAAQLKETHTAQQVVRYDPAREGIWPADTTDHMSYGLGWNVHDYRGHLIISHGGSLPGFRSHTVLVPKAKLGMVVLSNMGNVEGGTSRLPEAVVKNLLDRYLSLPARDWNEFTREAEAKALTERKKKDAEREKERIKGTKPSLDLTAYAGDYDDPAYGRARILRDGAGLKLEWSDFKAPLEHFHLDTFAATGDLPFRNMGLDDRVVFRLGAGGKVEGMTFLTREFKKAKEPGASLPVTKKDPVKDIYHGVTITDDYRWLEDGKSKDVQAWSDAQNAYARSMLDKLPGVDPIRGQVKKILTAKTISHGSLKYRGGRLFAIKRQPPKEQPFLVVMPSPEESDKARVLVDPTVLDAAGTTAIDFFVPSPDGKLVAVSLSKGGSESGDVHIYDVESGKEVFEVVPRVYGGTAGGDLAWKPDGKGFFYTCYPRGEERPEKDRDFYQQLYYHELGTPTEKDRYEMGKDLPRIAEIMLEMHDPTGRLLVSVQDGDSGRFAHYLRSPESKLTQFSSFGDGIVDAVFGPKGDVYAVSRKGSPRGKIIRLSGEKPDASEAKVIVPEGKDTIVTDFYRYVSPQTVLSTSNLLHVLYQLGGPSELRVFDLEGKPLPKPEQLEIGTVRGLTRLDGDDIIFANGSYVRPLEQYLYRAKNGKTEKLPLTSGIGTDLGDVRVVRDFATSKDGTKVPINIMIPKGVKLDGTNPCLVTGYGGYGLSREPSFKPAWRVLFDHGFVIAEVNLRGGSEFGEDWHKNGMLTRKQNVFDDFSAAIEHMIAKKYTSPDRLAIEGGSNGGLLMGATLTQHPELMKAVVSHVGIYDMLRVELSPNGAFNIPEFGTVKDEAQFKALHAYSPLHNVRDGTKYPAGLFLTGANDPRVDPMQSRKMTARLQSATTSKAPILLRTSASSGHGLDTSLSERIEEYVDVFAFLCDQLGVKVTEAKKP